MGLPVISGMGSLKGKLSEFSYSVCEKSRWPTTGCEPAPRCRTLSGDHASRSPDNALLAGRSLARSRQHRDFSHTLLAVFSVGDEALDQRGTLLRLVERDVKADSSATSSTTPSFAYYCVAQPAPLRRAYSMAHALVFG